MDKPDPSRNFGFVLHDVWRLLRRNFKRRARHLGLTQAQWQTLAHLSRNEGVNQAALAEILDIQPITLGRLIDRLEAMGLVERRDDPGDRRAFRLFLTAAAQPILEQIWQLAAETRAEAMADLPPDVREGLIDSLLTMKNSLLRQDAAFEEEAADGEKAAEPRRAVHG